MKRLFGAFVAILVVSVGGVVVAWAGGSPEVDGASTGTFTAAYRFTPATPPCAGEDPGPAYTFDRVNITGTSLDTGTPGDFTLKSVANGMHLAGGMVFNQGTKFGWAKGIMTINNTTGDHISGPYYAVLAPKLGGFEVRGQWVGMVHNAAGDITIENFEFQTPNTTFGNLVAGSGSWGGAPTNPNLSVKTKFQTC